MNRIDVLKKSILINANVTQVTSGSQLPTNIITSEGVNTKDGKRYESFYVAVDKDFFRALDINIIKGKERIEELQPQKNFDWKAFKTNL